MVLPSTCRIAAERRRPEPVRQYRGPRCLRTIVGCVQKAASHWAKTHHLEIRAADNAGADDARLTEPDHRESDSGKVPEGRQRLDASLQIPNLRHRKVRVFDSLAERGLPDVDQPAFVTIDERAQQHPPDDAENRGVGADAERQREHYGDGHSLDPQEGPQCVSKVGDEAHGANSPLSDLLHNPSIVFIRRLYRLVEWNWPKSTWLPPACRNPRPSFDQPVNGGPPRSAHGRDAGVGRVALLG